MASLFADRVVVPATGGRLRRVRLWVIGVPAAYALVRMNNRFSRAFRRIDGIAGGHARLGQCVGLAADLRQFGSFRSSWLFILVGHVLFTLPFLVRPVMAVMQRQQLPVLEEAAAKARRADQALFFSVVVPNCRAGILAGVLMVVVTLSWGEFNLTWMLHTPMTKTLPVGLAMLRLGAPGNRQRLHPIFC